jgi:hypothetical protein
LESDGILVPQELAPPSWLWASELPDAGQKSAADGLLVSVGRLGGRKIQGAEVLGCGPFLALVNVRDEGWAAVVRGAVAQKMGGDKSMESVFLLAALNIQKSPHHRTVEV